MRGSLLSEAISEEIQNMELEPLLFQTGYLTVKKATISIGPTVYLLEMPNLEVREAFNLQVLYLAAFAFLGRDEIEMKFEKL